MAAFDIDLVAAALRADSGDVGAFVEGLAAKLEEALPGKVAVQRSRRGMFGPKAVRSITVNMGEQRLELVRGDGEALETTRARLSGGIVLKRQTLEMQEWLGELGEALAREAERSERTRQALERLLMQ